MDTNHIPSYPMYTNSLLMILQSCFRGWLYGFRDTLCGNLKLLKLFYPKYRGMGFRKRFFLLPVQVQNKM